MERREFTRRSIGALVGAAALSLGLHGAGPRAAGQSGTPVDPITLVDPELRAVARAFSQPGAGARGGRGGGNTSAPPVRRTPERRTIPGPPGAPEVAIQIADPNPGSKGRPAFLHIHGGGYTFGVPAASYEVAERCGCVMVSVDYRLAPGTRFPGSLEDNYAALRWMYQNADALGIDRTRIAIGGESAGGGHAAALAIAARDRREVPILFQVLIYPMIDDRTGSTRSVPPHIGTFVWTREANRAGWQALLGQPPGLPTVPSPVPPARVDNLAGLPPTWIGVGDLDLFVEEDVQYALRLMAAGVPVQLEVVPGAFHGFDLVAPAASVSTRFTESWRAALRRAFSKTSG